jgi:hypothetical protein
MAAELDDWLKQATRGLAKESVAQVRSEIREHYESARDAAMQSGAAADEAEGSALAALGDANAVNRQYRHVLLTAGEARRLREDGWEAGLVCSRPWLKWLMAASALTAGLTAIALFLSGAEAMARVVAGAVLAMGPLALAAYLPIYTPSRARIFRCVKWAAMIGGLVLVFGPDARKMSWLLISSVWPMAWIEWKRMSIRRKLPVARWPKQLYI